MAEGKREQGNRAGAVCVKLKPDDFARLPYTDEGRSREGVDCYGLVWLWYRDVLGVDIPIYNDVPPSDRGKVREMMERQRAEWIVVDDPREHDVCMMRGLDPRFKGPGHIGIVMPKRRVMHMTARFGVTVPRLSDPEIKTRIIEFGRHISLV